MEAETIQSRRTVEVYYTTFVIQYVKNLALRSFFATYLTLHGLKKRENSAIYIGNH